MLLEDGGDIETCLPIFSDPCLSLPLTPIHSHMYVLVKSPSTTVSQSRTCLSLGCYTCKTPTSGKQVLNHTSESLSLHISNKADFSPQQMQQFITLNTSWRASKQSLPINIILTASLQCLTDTGRIPPALTFSTFQNSQ